MGNDNKPWATLTITLTNINANVNLNANFFEHELLGLAGARIFSLQKINGKDRKKQKLLPAAGYGNANRPMATLTLTLTLTKFDAILIMLADARIFSLQK